MTDFKTKQMIKLLENNGWTLARNSKHKVYKKGQSTIAIPHCKLIKRNTVKQILKTVESEA